MLWNVVWKLWEIKKAFSHTVELLGLWDILPKLVFQILNVKIH